jgi:hypothetical protein
MPKQYTTDLQQHIATIMSAYRPPVSAKNPILPVFSVSGFLHFLANIIKTHSALPRCWFIALSSGRGGLFWWTVWEPRDEGRHVFTVIDNGWTIIVWTTIGWEHRGEGLIV